MSSTDLAHLRKGDRVRVIDAKRREDLRWDGAIGRVGRERVYGELIVRLERPSQPTLPLEGPNALIVELLEPPAESR